MTYDIERGGMSYMRPGKVKEVGLDIVADIVGSFFIAVGVYNFAVVRISGSRYFRYCDYILSFLWDSDWCYDGSLKYSYHYHLL